MTVGDYMASENLTKDHFANITDENEYWFKAGTFVLDNWNRELTSLSDKQNDWLRRINEDMTEKRIEGHL